MTDQLEARDDVIKAGRGPLATTDVANETCPCCPTSMLQWEPRGDSLWCPACGRHFAPTPPDQGEPCVPASS